MQTDIRTEKMTRRSSLCKSISLELPKGWDDLTQEQLRQVLRILWLHGEDADWQNMVRLSAMLYFCSMEVEHVTDQGWLCRRADSEETFILATELLPDILAHLDFLCHPELISQRLEMVGKYKAVDFNLQNFEFGYYLSVDNHYQTFLLTRQQTELVAIARFLYRIPEGNEAPELREEVLTGVFLWVSAVKILLSQNFPHFLKPATSQEPVTQELLAESMRAQIRLLTKGDVTKQESILNVDTWTALGELEALARESEEIREKYGK